MITAMRKPTIKMIDEYMLLSQGIEISNRNESDGVFLGCLGTLEDIEYLDESWNIKKIQSLIISEYETRSIGFETWQDFYINFRNTWNRNFYQFRQNIENAVKEFTLFDYVRDNEYERNDILKDNIFSGNNTKGSMETSSSHDNKFSNTPNEYIQNSDNFNGLTSIDLNNNNSETTQDYESTGESHRDKDLNIKEKKTTIKTNNSFEKWLELSSKNRNIVYDFIDKFSWLFQTTTNIYSF